MFCLLVGGGLQIRVGQEHCGKRLFNGFDLLWSVFHGEVLLQLTSGRKALRLLYRVLFCVLIMLRKRKHIILCGESVYGRVIGGIFHGVCPGMWLRFDVKRC